MGTLIDFYTGDEEKIVRAITNSYWDELDSSCIVSKHVCLSFHLLLCDDLDALLAIICKYKHASPVRFEELLEYEFYSYPPDVPETAVYRLSPEFRELFLNVSENHLEQIIKEWILEINKNGDENKHHVSKSQIITSKLKYKILECIMFPIILITCAIAWLFDPKFRKDRHNNKKKREKEKKDPKKVDNYTIEKAIVHLFELCEYAEANNQSVIFYWSI